MGFHLAQEVQLPGLKESESEKMARPTQSQLHGQTPAIVAQSPMCSLVPCHHCLEGLGHFKMRDPTFPCLH